jgi:hypothetical protein
MFENKLLIKVIVYIHFINNGWKILNYIALEVNQSQKSKDLKLKAYSFKHQIKTYIM